MKSYYRLMLGQKSCYATDCFEGGFIGAGFGFEFDLKPLLGDDVQAFKQKLVPIYLENHPGKTKPAGSVSCGFLWTVVKGMLEGDMLLCPDGLGNYHVGEVTGGYYYKAEEILPHRRPVKWQGQKIAREEMSEALKNSTGSIGTVSNVTKYAEEIEKLLIGMAPPKIVATDDVIEDPTTFAMEKHLEEFLVQNWQYTELGKDYDIYEDEGEKIGQQYPTDTGPIDVLALSKDGKELLVVELKRGRASDVVVGQILRYMGYVQDELAEDHQTVRGVVIALQDDPKLKRALAMVPSVAFYRYAVSFKLTKG